MGTGKTGQLEAILRAPATARDRVARAREVREADRLIGEIVASQILAPCVQFLLCLCLAPPVPFRYLSTSKITKTRDKDDI